MTFTLVDAASIDPYLHQLFVHFMAEAVDTLVEDTQKPRILEAEEIHLGGVGSTTTTHLAEPADGRKRVGGSSPGKVRGHFNLRV